MSAYEEDADRLAEHTPEECDDPYCQLCIDEEIETEVPESKEDSEWPPTKEKR